MFHTASVLSHQAVAVFLNVTMVLPPNMPLTADLANSYFLHANVQAAFLPPSVLKDISQDAEMVQNVGRLQHLVFGGSPIAPEVGRILAPRTHLINIIGSTEVRRLRICALEAAL